MNSRGTQLAAVGLPHEPVQHLLTVISPVASFSTRITLLGSVVLPSSSITKTIAFITFIHITLLLKKCLMKAIIGYNIQ